MKRLTHFVAAVILAATVLALVSSTVMAGRIGGPMSTTAVVSLGNSASYDIPFECNERAVITVTATGNAIVQVWIYDSNGRVVMSSGLVDRKTATLTMDVTRAGVFRVEIRNLGVRDSAFTLKTN